MICRYQSQNGRYVERRFGWDCHGLPVEFEIDKKLGIKEKGDVLKMGIDKYNEECRKIVMRYSSEWEATVKRCGRWIDFENDYKTLYPEFMESIWWVFKQMWDKGLVYRGCKVMPYSNGCSTVLSNFETQQNYQETLDPSLFVTFPLEDEPDTNFIAWTTTPWTLPANLALAVNPTFDYLKVYDTTRNTHFILASCRLHQIYSDQAQYRIVATLKGHQLVGKRYLPLFDHYLHRKKTGCFQIIPADFVTDDAGTGVVHCAPAFGADDYKVCLSQGLIQHHDPPLPLDEKGHFTET